MNKDTTYKKFVARWEEVVDLPVQTLGPFTPLYKRVVRQLKTMPFVPLIFLASGIVFLLYFLFGPAITRIVSVLQKGF